MLFAQFQHSHLGGKDEPFVVGDDIAAGAQAVAVQHRAHHIAVAEENGSRSVPGLHHGGVVLVKIPPPPGDGVVVAPGLRDGHHHRKGQVHAAHHQKFQGVVQHGGVGPGSVHHRKHPGDVVGAEGGGAHGFLPGQHFVCVAPDGVDLAVVDDEAVGMGPLPAWVCVGGKTGMDDGNGGFKVLVPQIVEKGAQLPHQEHSLVDDGPAGKAGHIAAPVALLKDPPHDVEPAVKGEARGHVLRLFHKALTDHRHAVPRPVAQHAGPHRHRPPAEKFQPFFFHDDLKHLLRLAAGQFVLRQKEHANAVFPLAADENALGGAHFAKELVGHLGENAHAVAGFALGVFAGTVLQMFHDGQRVGHRLVALAAVNVHNGAYAAVVMFKFRAVKPLAAGRFHGGTSRSQNKKGQRRQRPPCQGSLTPLSCFMIRPWPAVCKALLRESAFCEKMRDKMPGRFSDLQH